jgi:hypothetical protein
MRSTEELNLLWLRFSKEPELAPALRRELEALFARDDYRAWHKSEPRQPFAGDLSAYPLLARCGLTGPTGLEVKVNRIGDRYFITDGAWVDHVMRSFPDPDEAFVLLDFVKEQGLEDWPGLVVDPGAGSGHTPIGFPGRKVRRVSCDANVRALSYASINARLNDLGPAEFLAIVNDMNLVLPEAIRPEGNTLFLANVPFAPAPDDDSLALNSAGGDTGADLQVASFRMAAKFRAHHRVSVRACFLTWTLGDADRDWWEVPELCERELPGAKIKWHLIRHDYDAPELPNPSPLGPMLKHLASSQYAVGDSAKRQQSFSKLEEKLTRQGFRHIAYGMLYCELA